MNSKFWFGVFTLAIAAIISAVAGYFSIVGLIALFAAHGVAVAIMGGSLELGKLVASGWLKINWSNPRLNFLHKSYLLIAVAMLMLITSIGIYGFLAAGHLEQQAPMAGLAVQTQQIEIKLAQTTDQNKRIEQRLNQIDQNISVFLKNDQASRGLRASGSLKTERDQLQKTLEANNQEINALNSKLVPLKMQSSEVEAKLGPIKYVGALFGWEDSESAVRFVIIILMVAFDPLAVILMLSGIITLREWADERLPEIETFDDPPAEWLSDADYEASKDEDVAVHDDLVEEEEETVEDNEDLIAELVQVETLRAEARAEAEKAAQDAAREALIPKPVFLTPVDLPKVEIEPEIEPEPEPEPVAEPIVAPVEIAPTPELSRDDVIAFLEQNPGIVSELAQIVEEQHEHELTDREKLLDLLEKNPTIINDMAEIIASQITPKSDRWLG